MNVIQTDAVKRARAWIEWDKTDPYSGGYVGELMQELLNEILTLRASDKLGWEMYDKARVLAEGL